MSPTPPRLATRSRPKLACALAAALALGGCGTDLFRTPPLPPAAVAPAYRAALRMPAAQEGAIYQAGRSTSYFEDPRAHQVGDVITIRLQEAFNATKTATTKTAKDSSAALTAPVIGGWSPFGDTAIGGKRAFTGNGTSSQQNQLTGSITAVVTEVLPNGNLLVSGERALQLNQGEEYVRVSGVVRAVDVQLDNSVTSDRIADARISYSGRGALDASNRQGWLSRFFNSPITPF